VPTAVLHGDRQLIALDGWQASSVERTTDQAYVTIRGHVLSVARPRGDRSARERRLEGGGWSSPPGVAQPARRWRAIVMDMV